MPSLTAEELHGNRLQWLYAIDVLIETQGEVCLLPLPGDAAEGCFRRCGFVSGSEVAINPRWSCRSTAASRHGRQSRKPVRTRRWSLRLKSNWHSIRRKQSEAGMHAGVTGWQSMTWKPCSGSGRAFSVTVRNGTLAVAEYAVLAGYCGSQSCSKRGRSRCP